MPRNRIKAIAKLIFRLIVGEIVERLHHQITMILD